MHFKAIGKPSLYEARLPTKTLLVMKLIFVLTFIATLQTSAGVFGQNITLTRKDASLESILREIKVQSGYDFMFNTSWLRKAHRITLDVQDVPLEKVLDLCFKDQPFTYTIISKTIVMKERDEKQVEAVARPGTPPDPLEVTGNVTDENGEPLSGATVKLKDGKVVAITDEKGHFKLKNISPNATIEISYTGYSAKNVEIGNQTSFKVSLSQATNKLDEVQVIAYGTTTQRLSTGNITKVTSKEIEEQPVSNVLAALEGRVPGLVITQQTGMPGGGFTVQIRGQNSIGNGNDPFYVVDGVPYNSEIPFIGNGLGLINSSLKGGNPLNFINPYDIESVEVLKDADATAIYGSRAANGAILITTKKGKAGAMKVNLSANSGFSKPSRDPKLLNTQQYLSMRHEAFANDGETPQSYDYDVNGVWDTTRYTNWSKVLLNSHPVYNDYEASVSGGTTSTQWLVGAGYTRQTTGLPTRLPGDGADQRPSVHFNINNISPNKRFKIVFTGSYLSDKNTVQSQDLSQNRFQLAPDAPALFNSDGSLNWQPLVPGNAGTFSNPFATLNIKYRGLTSNLVGNAVIGYTILPGLELKTSLGYTNTQIDQLQTRPTTLFDPGLHRTSGSSIFETMNTRGWIIEPQINYSLHFGAGLLTALAGSSFHSNQSTVQYISATGFISDALLEDAQAASSKSVLSTSSQYNYDAAFGRLNYNFKDKYIVNLTARRDGSSRFGPGKQFGNFGAIGAAWIFTQEDFMQRLLPFLSFGKLRASYGTAGNDQIGDYQFLDLYRATPYPYQGTQGLYPLNLFNPNLAWEIDKKLEGGMELGFLKDRITVQANYYRNRSNNQLISTPVSLVTGYSSVPANFPALVQNSGGEFVFHTINIKTKNFSWTSSFNLSLARNKLLAFPNFSSSGYTYNLMIGQPITIQKVFHLIGVNDTTGLYQFASSKAGPTYNPDPSADRISMINPTPKYYGGFENSFTYKGFSLDFLFQFVKQTGLNIWGAYEAMPGVTANMPVSVLNRWQKPGDNKPYQMFSQDYSSNAYNQLSIAEQSDFIYGDASFIRLKNLAISWQVPSSWRQKIHFENLRFYINAQNLLTITHYNGIDPESQSIGSPPKKIWTGGFQITF